jgi:hypothetical protein
MTRINFDEPSTGNVNSVDMALEINQRGDGGAIMAKSKKNVAVIVEAGDVFGQSGIGISASGYGENATGIEGRADKGIGVKGTSLHHTGIVGMGKEAGVSGYSTDINGVGVSGLSDWQAGVLGKSDRGKVGVHGECSHVDGAGVEGVNTNTQKGIGVLGKGKIAGRFEGDVEVTGDIKLLNPQNADCAEDFDILHDYVDPGTVMVLTETGSLQPSFEEYDKKVTGIVSGAGGYKPAFVLNRLSHSEKEDLNENLENRHNIRLPIALMGKVYCKVDASNYSIEIGDLLTTSSTKGCAMKAEDPMKAFGAVLGKALGSLKEGIGMIPVLVALQ